MIDLADQIKSLVTIQEVVEYYGFHPNRAGYLCCPFHNEKTASLKLYGGRRGWHCFGCGAGGTVIDFVMGLDYTPKWANCFITSGETPLVGETDGAGAVNRVVEIECRHGEAVIRDGHRTANALKLNYGHAGKRFIDHLCREGEMDRARERYEKNYAVCMQSDTTEKQAMAAALIITADQLATEWIFHDGRALAASELGEFLKEKNEVSTSERGYEYMCGWVAAHVNQFRENMERGDRYGVIDGDIAMINRTIWNKACEEAGLSPKALLGHLKSKGLIITSGKAYTKTKRIDGVAVHCVWMILPPEDGEQREYDDVPL